MKMRQITKTRINLLGGFLALLGCFLPFWDCRSLYLILENEPIPFFLPMMVLLVVLAMVLHCRNHSEAAGTLALVLFLAWLFLLFILDLCCSIAVVLQHFRVGAYLLPLGLLLMAL